MDEVINIILKKLEEQSTLEKTKALDIKPEDRMLAITWDTGKFFNLLLRALKAKNILEIGTSTGFSTIWCAEAIKDNPGKIITIEKNQNKINRAKKNFQEAGILDLIEIRQGDAIDILTDLLKKNFENYFDFVLIDADKERCVKYFDIILPMVKKNGIIVTDNVLYPERFRPEMQNLVDHIADCSKVISVTIPVGNGEEVTMKIKD